MLIPYFADMVFGELNALDSQSLNVNILTSRIKISDRQLRWETKFYAIFCPETASGLAAQDTRLRL
jgi:hypothetical protein